MIHLAPRHLDLLQKLLHPYDCSFYLFGSRLGTKAKPFSDIDLLYFEELPPPALYALEEALEESDLPYKVDLVYYPSCDEVFKQLIKRDYVCIQASSRLREVERNHELHFQFFPRLLEYAVRAKPEEILYIYCSLGSSLFNIVYGQPSFQDRVGEVEATIAETISHFQGQPFAWWVPPSKRDPNFTKALLKAGFVLEAYEEAMSYDLSAATHLKQKTGLSIQQVQSQALLKEFINLFQAGPLALHLKTCSLVAFSAHSFSAHSKYRHNINCKSDTLVG